MEPFEQTEMVPGRAGRRVRSHCSCEMDLMPGGRRSCIFEGADVGKKAISGLIVSLFTHLQKSCLKQTPYSNFLSVHRGSTCSSSSSAFRFLCEAVAVTCCGGRCSSVESTPIKKKSRLHQPGEIIGLVIVV